MSIQRRKSALMLAAGCAAAVTSSSFAAEYTWTPTATGTYDWPTNTQSNWGTTVGGAFPSVAGDIANINQDVAAQTINLNTAITLGTLNIGDAGLTAPALITLSANGGSLAFNSGSSAAATINSTPNATLGGGVTINPVVSLGSALIVNHPANNTINFNGGFTGNGHAITFNNAGRTDGASSLNVNGGITGAGTKVTKLGAGVLSMSASSSFSGGLAVNEGTFIVSGTTGALTGLTNTNGVTVANNGFFTLGGNSNGVAGGRLVDTAKVTMAGGHFSFNGGNDANGGTETVGALDFAKGSSVMSIRRSTNTVSTLTISTLTRSVGATAQLRAQDRFGPNAGVPGTNEQYVFASNGVSLSGANGAAGSKTMSIVPWMVIGEGSAIINNQPTNIATYTSTDGFRQLTTGEYDTVAAGTADSNVSTGNATLSGNRTFNSVRMVNTNNTLNVGAANTLTIQSGLLVLTAGNSVLNGQLKFERSGNPVEAIVFVTNLTNSTISSNITAANGLTKGSTGNLTLSGANTYTGPTHIGAGTIIAGATNTLPSTTAVIINDSSPSNLGSPIAPRTTMLDLAGFSQTIGSLSGGGTYGGNITLGTATLTTGGDNTSTTYGGVMSGTGGSLIKNGTGAFNLTGSNTYTGGTTVNNGTLAVNNTTGSATGSGAVSIAAAGTLAGSGNVAGNVTVNGTLSPGNSPGTLTVGGNLVLNPDGDYNWQVYNADETGAVAGTDYDTINLTTGALNLSALAAGDEFNINLWSLSSVSPDTNGAAVNWDASQAHTWTLISTTQSIAGFDGDEFIVNVASNNGTSGFQNGLSGGTFDTALSQDGTDLLLTYTPAAIPEPTSMGLVALGGLALRRRRRA